MCNGNVDCRDVSDEDPETCKGTFNILLTDYEIRKKQNIFVTNLWLK